MFFCIFLYIFFVYLIDKIGRRLYKKIQKKLNFALKAVLKFTNVHEVELDDRPNIPNKNLSILGD